jgi:MinD-like ATPase involved in chromosome partitioning or flagellar assembly
MTPTLVVASGKGGVGTSMIASMIGVLAAERGEHVLLVDATEGAGALHQLFATRPVTSLWHLITPKSNPTHVLLAVDEHLVLVAGGTSASAAPPSTDHERRAALMRLAYTFTRFDLVVIDAGSRLSSVAAIADVTDAELLLVTSADRLSLAANYALVKTIATRRPDMPMSVLANRHGEDVADEACGFLRGACTHFLARTLDVAGFVPDDPCQQAGVGAGMSVRDAIDGSPAAEALRPILTKLFPPRGAMLVPAAAIAGSEASLPPTSLRRWS